MEPSGSEAVSLFLHRVEAEQNGGLQARGLSRAADNTRIEGPRSGDPPGRHDLTRPKVRAGTHADLFSG